MSELNIAQAYVALVKEGQHLELIKRFYTEDAASVEAVAMPGEERIAVGIDAIRGKSQWFDANFKVDSQEIRGPWPHGEDKFAVHMTFDMTHLESGQSSSMDEIVVLTVRDGKISKEEFFYTP